MRGIVRMVRAYDSARKENRNFTPEEACAIGIQGEINNEVRAYITLFAVEGLYQVNSWVMTEVVLGRQHPLWLMTKRFVAKHNRDSAVQEK